MGCTGRGKLYGAGDIAYFAAMDAERIKSSGTDAEYYSLNRGKNVDVVYGEVDNDPLYGGTNPKSPLGTPQTHDWSWNFCPDTGAGEMPLVITVAAEYSEFENFMPMVRPEGRSSEDDLVMSVSAAEWECAIANHGSACLKNRTPKVGDVVYVFNNWWDVVKVGESGNILGTPIAVGFRFDLKHRSQFNAGRKVDK